MKKQIIVLLFCGILAHADGQIDLAIRVANGLMSENALAHVATSFEEAQPSRKKCLKAVLSECKLTVQELASLKSLLQEMSELLPTYFMLKNDFDKAFNAQLKVELIQALGQEQADVVLDNKVSRMPSQQARKIRDTYWIVQGAVYDALSANPQYAPYIEMKDRIEEIFESVSYFGKQLAEKAHDVVQERGAALKGVAGFYAMIMLSQFTDECLEVIDELSIKSS